MPQSVQTANEQASHSEHGSLTTIVATIWRVLRGMGVSTEDVTEATRLSFDHAFTQRSLDNTPATLSGLPMEHVIDPLLAAAYRAARAEWRPLLHSRENDDEETEVGSSTVRFQGELLVLGLLGTLDEPKRTCLLLADMEQFSSPEIAALTGLRLDVVYDELRKARKAFERARKRQDQAGQAGATLDAEAEPRALLALARTRFAPPAATLASLCEEFWTRFGAGMLNAPSTREPGPGPGSAV